MFDAPSFAQGEVVGTGDVRGVSYGEDKGLFVEFRNEPIYMEYLSEQAGRAIYEDRTFVKIYVPGDKTKVIDRLAQLKDIGGIPPDDKRWPIQWLAFQNGMKAVMNGTPLSEWPKITKQQVGDFNAFNIYTVEQLSEVSDTALDGLGHGGRALRDGAIKWLERAGDDSAITKMESAFAQREAAMQRQIDEMRELLEMQTAPPEETRRGPGRPKKDATDGE